MSARVSDATQIPPTRRFGTYYRTTCVANWRGRDGRLARPGGRGRPPLHKLTVILSGVRLPPHFAQDDNKYKTETAVLTFSQLTDRLRPRRHLAGALDCWRA